MPVEFVADEDNAIDEVELYDEHGIFVPEAAVLNDFLESIDFEDFFTDPSLQEHVTSEKVFGKFDEDGEFVPCAPGDPQGWEDTVETIPGEIVAESIDPDDLYGMFKTYVNQYLAPAANEGMVDKLRYAAAAPLLDEADLIEAGPFKKGAFKKIYHGKAKTGGGKSGKNVVMRMALAMFHKQSIKRTPKGTGYQKGTWNRDSGYAPGTEAGKKKVAAYKAGKGKSKGDKAKKLKGNKTTKFKAAVLQGKKAAAAKGKATFGKSKGKLASSDYTGFHMHEGVSMAARAIGRQQKKQKQLNEARK